MPEKLINCGVKRVQKLGRVSISDACKLYGIKEGEIVEVYLKKVEKNV